MKDSFNLLTLLLLTCFLFLSSCNSPKIRSYTIPKEAIPALQTAQPQHQHLSWDTPDDWLEKPASGMRLGSYYISNYYGVADMSIVSLSGMDGGLIANLNRWRGQLHLNPVDQSDLPNFHSKRQINGLAFDYFKLTSDTILANKKENSSMIVAMLKYKEHHYFFKATGEKSMIEKIEPSFLTFLESIKLK